MEVEEEDYAKLVSKRRQDEFVEEDGDDLGYKDDGEEAWNRYAAAAPTMAPSCVSCACLYCLCARACDGGVRDGNVWLLAETRTLKTKWRRPGRQLASSA